MTAARHTAVLKYTFPANEAKHVLVDLAHVVCILLFQVDSRLISSCLVIRFLVSTSRRKLNATTAVLCGSIRTERAILDMRVIR